MNEQKAKHNKLRHSRLAKEKLLHELKDQLVIDTHTGSLDELQQKVAELVSSFQDKVRLIGTEEQLIQSYEHMRLQRDAAQKAYEGKVRRLKDELKEVNKRLKEKMTSQQLFQKESERLSMAEEQLRQRLVTEKQQREALVKEELDRYRATLQIHVFSEKTRMQREHELRLDGKERKLELLEEAYSQSRKEEILEMKLNGQLIEQSSIERSFVDLKNATHAETAEEVVYQYEAALRRKEQLKQFETEYEAEIERKKATLSEIRAQKGLLMASFHDSGSLLELETRVINRESAAEQKENDLKRINETVAQVTNSIQQLYTTLKKYLPGFEDTKLSPSRLDEVCRLLDALMRAIS